MIILKDTFINKFNNVEQVGEREKVDFTLGEVVAFLLFFVELNVKAMYTWYIFSILFSTC